MTTFALDSNYDIYIDSKNNLALFTTDSLNETKQDITNILKLWAGDADYDITRGVIYRKILGQTGPSLNQSVVKNNISTQLLLVNNVKSVLQLELTIKQIKQGNRLIDTLLITTEILLTSGLIINATN